jgi:hypothetical protein
LWLVVRGSIRHGGRHRPALREASNGASSD